MVTGEIKVALMVSHGIRVTKAVAKCVLSNGSSEDNDMLSINNNNCDYKERERQVIELYDQGKSTRDIAKELRMSLRDISTILRKNHKPWNSISYYR